ncbi:MAG: replication initiator protein [Microviridae sp.]|nr:MAG: replication initiator protein [Microviridae sp.]
MPCYSPLEGFRSRQTTDSGKRKLVFNAVDGFRDLPVTVPCGHCLGCRLERARQWAVRLMHEKSCHELSTFVTLTYDDEHLPESGSLVMAHFQTFLKDLRNFHEKDARKLIRDGHKNVKVPTLRFFHCGEYGETNRRPHYHAILFGIDFADKTKHSKNRQGDQIYKSETLNKIWGRGHCWIGSVTQKSCAYVARYIMKKVTGEAAPAHYRNVNLETGEIYDLHPEYVTMSRRPGIGAAWFEKFRKDVFPSDTVIANGKEQLPPKYYLRKLAETSPKSEAKIKAKRVRRAKKHSADSTPERLRARLICKQSQISQLKRNL